MKELPVNTESIDADVAVIGSGAAGLMAVLHIARKAPQLSIALVSKGAVGRSGCSIMTHGFNAVLDPEDSLESHFKDLIRTGDYLNDQELAWAVVNGAPEMIRELESEAGCFFDRRSDGSIHQKPFAGQSFNRKVYRGDEIGLEIMNRLREQLLGAQPIELGDVRALDLILDGEGEVAGVTLLDTRRGVPIVLRTRIVIVATGGATNLYRVASSAREKTGDGMAMCYRAGAEFRDMEMVQFLSVGMVSEHSRVAGIPLEERLRVAGAHLYNGVGERFMQRYQPDLMERASRDEVIRASYMEILAGRGTSAGGVLIDARHLGGDKIQTQFADVAARALLLGKNLAVEPVEICPTAHFQIGGVVIDCYGKTNISGLLVAGEDAGGAHGASWVGGNGIAESTVFGARAGEYAADLCTTRYIGKLDSDQVASSFQRAFAPLTRKEGPDPMALTQELRDLMWQRVGPVRDAAGLAFAVEAVNRLKEQVNFMSVSGPTVANQQWQCALDLQSQITVAEMIMASACVRTESRGAHYRSDYPQRNDEQWMRYIVVTNGADGPATESRPVVFSRTFPEGRQEPR